MFNLRHSAAGLVLAAAMLAGAPAVCADAPAPNAHSVELARKLFTEMRMEQLMGNAMRQMAPAMIAQSRKNNPALSDQDAEAITEAVTESSAVMMQKMIDRMIPLYASTFTEKELQDVVNFYDTPSGQAMLAKMPALMSKMTPMMVELMPETTADMTKRICAKIDCSKRATPLAPKN